MKKLFVIFLICSGIYAYLNYDIPYIPKPPENLKFFEFFEINKRRPVLTTDGRLSSSDNVFHNAFKEKKRKIVINGSGKVIKILTDQFGGGKRQRFLIILSSGQKLEIKHNIDEINRLPVKIGDSVEFSGIYNWNKKGGKISKTDSRSRNNQSGWLKLNGTMYK